MKKSVFLILTGVLFYACSDNKEQITCEDFKTGTFEYYEDSIRIVIERKETIQIEKTPFGDSKYELEWLSDCEYNATLTETNFNALEEKIGTVYEIEITSTSENAYSYQVKVRGMEFIYFGEMKKVGSL